MKQLQWHCHKEYGEDEFVVLLGGLHTEKAALTLPGDLLNGCGWVEVISESAVIKKGRAESCFGSSFITRTRESHQVTVAALYYLVSKAYQAGRPIRSLLLLFTTLFLKLIKQGGPSGHCCCCLPPCF